MKLRGLIDEKFGLPGNAGREFGEKFMRELIGSGKLAELWTAFEATYPELQPELQKTFEKTNELLRYIKPEQGGETYRVSSMPEAAAQELDNLLHDVLETLEFVSSQNEEPGIEMVKSVIKDFDNIFSDMLNIFTSNTDSDKPLEPYKQSNIGFGVNENIDDEAADLWNKYKGKIFADTNVERRTRRGIQVAVLTDPQYAIKWIEKWAAKNDEDYEHPDDWPPKDKALGEEYCPDCRAKLREIVKKTIAECWKTHKQVGMKKKGGKTVPNCVPKNEGSSWDGSASKNPGMWDGKPSEKQRNKPFPAMGEEVDEAKTKPAKGKRFAKKVKNKKTGRTRTVSYGQAGKAKKGGDRIRPGTAKGHAYCARSAKIKKCKNPPCANTLSRKKWKCQGSRSVPE